MDKLIRHLERLAQAGDYDALVSLIRYLERLVVAGETDVIPQYKIALQMADRLPLGAAEIDKLDAWGEFAAGKLILAEAHSDDHEMFAFFNALPWFEQATDKKIVDLAREGYHGWGRSLSADRLAEWVLANGYDKDRESLRQLFEYLDYLREDGEDDLAGYECSVYEDTALDWISRNRPHLLPRLTG